MRRGLRLAYLLCLVATCTATGPSRSSLEADPAAQLRMPGATELAHGGNEARMSVDGPVHAMTLRVFGIDGSPSDVFAHYDRQLKSLGWAPRRPSVRVFEAATIRTGRDG